MLITIKKIKQWTIEIIKHNNAIRVYASNNYYSYNGMVIYGRISWEDVPTKYIEKECETLVSKIKVIG